MAPPAFGAIITLNGTLGRRFSFTAYPWGTPLVRAGGVYVVLNSDSALTPITYVGQTGDLSERFDAHHKALCFVRHGRTHIAVLLEGNETQRRLIESELIRSNNPPCNG